MKEPKVLRVEVMKKDMVDVKGMTLRKGMRVAVIKEVPTNFLGGILKIVRVDNGTGFWSLCPETAFVEKPKKKG